MITDPCKCGIKPESHAHIANRENEVIFWKGIPIVKDQKSRNIYKPEQETSDEKCKCPTCSSQD